jgi:hypothetical protein
MSFAKPETIRETIDEVAKLMCSVSGCTNRWSVSMGQPKCSFHQWGPKIQGSTVKQIEKPVVKTWYEEANVNF